MFTVNAAPVHAPSSKEAIHWLMAAYREAGFPRQRIISTSVDVKEEPGYGLLADEDKINRGWLMTVTIKMRWWTITWRYGVEFYPSWVNKMPEKDGQRYEYRGSHVFVENDRCDLPTPEVFEWQYDNFQELQVAAALLNDSEVVFIRAEDYMSHAQTHHKPQYFDGEGNLVKVIHAWAVPKNVYTSGLVNHLNDAFYSRIECPTDLQAYSCSYAYVNYGVKGEPWMLKSIDPDFKEWDGSPSFKAELYWGSSFDSPMDRFAPPEEPNPQDKAHVNVSFPVTQIMFADRPPKSVQFD